MRRRLTLQGIIAALATAACGPRPPGPETQATAATTDTTPARSAPSGADRERESPRAPLRPGAYDLGTLPVFSKALFFTSQNYVEPSRFTALPAFLGAVERMQALTPEMMVEHWYDPREPWITVRVGDRTRSVSVKEMNAPWHLRSAVSKVAAFLQDNLPPVPPGDEGPRLLAIELGATNGMLQTLDPRSMLLDAGTYKGMFGSGGWPGALNVSVGRDREDRIVVTSAPVDGPAARAGVRVKDRLLRIGDLATANMNLDDVVDHLQGNVGTTVELTIERDGVQGTRKITAIRAQVHAAAVPVAHRLLTSAGAGSQPGKVIGYFRLAHFTSSAARETSETLAAIAKENVAGIILDLRGNQGGLYEQAGRVADLFLKTGTIVRMTARTRTLKDDRAGDDGNEPTVPLAVLVDRQTAAGAEIVAAALKHLDRAVIIGERTYGSGSLQVLFDIPSPLGGGDKLGLKLTTAQWVSPTGISVQGAGLTPDVEISTQQAEKRNGRFVFRLDSTFRRKESDYVWALDAQGAPADQPPFASLPSVPRHASNSPDAARDDDEDDSPVRFADGEEYADADGRDLARDLAVDILTRSTSNDRRQMLAQARSLIDDTRAGEERRLTSALSANGIDWSAGSRAGGESSIELKLAVSPEAAVVPGGSVVIRARATNTGAQAIHRLRTILIAANPFLNGKEIALGTVAAGQTRSGEVEIKIPATTPSLTDEVTARLAADEPVRVDQEPLLVTVNAPGRPVFSLDYDTADEEAPAATAGAGEATGSQTRRIKAEIRNLGPVAARDVIATLRRAPGQQGVVIDAGYFRTADLKPGERMTCVFVYRTTTTQNGDQPYRFDLAVGAGAANASTHRLVVPAGGGAVAGHVSPPSVTATAPLVVSGSTVRVSAQMASDGGLTDAYIFVEGPLPQRPMQKVFYKALAGSQPRASIGADVPVSRGRNQIHVIARGADGVSTSAPLIVLGQGR
ncbi:MAG TPA: S41 family peptidase [Polyangia bacterium]|nr:S41 family peptidase [Polyangia bacterium]